MTQLYFAYGSNLDRVAWTDFCQERGFSSNCILPFGKAYLPDEKLVFDYRSQRHGGGVLDIRPHKGALVEGHLFAITEEGLRALDKKEGHPKFYRQETVIVIDPNGTEVEAITYRVVPEKQGDFVAPTEKYLESCRRGMERFEICTNQLELASKNDGASICPAVFCYGTLMRHEIRHENWTDLATSYACLALAQGEMVHHDFYPGFIPAIGQSDSLVHGEFLVFADIAEALARFDAIEGFHKFGSKDNLFRRTLVTVDVGGGRPRLAWTYATSRLQAPIVASGDWREHRGVRVNVYQRLLAELVARHSNFFARLVHTPHGPFSTLYNEEPTFDQVLADLLSGAIEERSLLLARSIF